MMDFANSTWSLKDAVISIVQFETYGFELCCGVNIGMLPSNLLLVSIFCVMEILTSPSIAFPVALFSNTAVGELVGILFTM